ncbi:Peptidase, trypsin-like serine and cysteine proteases [Musa troglodytarum]|uniref:Peptidase, trypsin-like serine and cysteine proteases n=1 Tax=Musa troglodytarum TaxID=320322 RepID=A0A9E7HIE6_9LILI|nr:Peptidase, trypsin-like serine and cysteine proteases [Musa troglodytarum]URE33776.1 Peptidase, trypsin-like serine and cysteine proteases [Musa troglodytarum]
MTSHAPRQVPRRRRHSQRHRDRSLRGGFGVVRLDGSGRQRVVRSHHGQLSREGDPTGMSPLWLAMMWDEQCGGCETAEDRCEALILPSTPGLLTSASDAATGPLSVPKCADAETPPPVWWPSLGTAIGISNQEGTLTDIPAIIVFVARKVHKKWLSHDQILPSALEGPGGVWCDVDVVEFSYYAVPTPTSKEQLYNELVDGLRGSDLCIGSGLRLCSLFSFQPIVLVICAVIAICIKTVASQATYGTLGAIVKSRTGNKQVGFLTNRHVAVDMNYSKQKMFHPLPPNLGPGVYLGAVERATSFITDDVWYGIYAGTKPVTGLGEIGDVKVIDLQSSINGLIGRRVVKVGRSSGLTNGIVMAYAFEYNDEKGICFFTDLLVVGENQHAFDLEGDSGSLIILTGQDAEKPKPIGIIWGGTANRGRLKLKSGHAPENWTSGVDLGRLLDHLELDLITSSKGLQDALQDQRFAMAAAINSNVGKCREPSK